MVIGKDIQFSSVTQSCVNLQSHGLQHARLPCPSPTTRAESNSGPSSQWCHTIISSSDVPYSSCIQSYQASGSFQMSQFFIPDGQSIGASVFFFFFPFIFISWRLITLQYCSGFCHTLTWISHGFTCVPLPDLSSRLPLHPIPWGFSFSISLSN